MPTAIVTGASMGLGEALAHGLARAGWSLVIDARGQEALARAAARIRGELAPGAQLTAIGGDVTDPSHRAALVAAAGRLGELQLLVNNASALGPTPLPALTGYPLEGLRSVARGQRGGAARSDPGSGRGTAAGHPAPGGQHHV